jgi:hypothetical protein
LLSIDVAQKWHSAKRSTRRASPHQSVIVAAKPFRFNPQFLDIRSFWTSAVFGHPQFLDRSFWTRPSRKPVGGEFVV